MDKKFERLTIEEWKEKFKPVNEDMLDNTGADFEFLKNVEYHHVWTVCDDGENSIIESGWHIVNAIGAYVTVIPWEDGTQIFVYDEKDESKTYYDSETGEKVVPFHTPKTLDK